MNKTINLTTKQTFIFGAAIGLSAFLVPMLLGKLLPAEFFIAFMGPDNFMGMGMFMLRHAAQLLALLLLVPVWLTVAKRFNVVRPGFSVAAAIVLTYVVHTVISPSFIALNTDGYWLATLAIHVAVGCLVTPLAFRLFARIKYAAYVGYTAILIFGILPFAADALANNIMQQVISNRSGY